MSKLLGLDVEGFWAAIKLAKWCDEHGTENIPTSLLGEIIDIIAAKPMNIQRVVDEATKPLHARIEKLSGPSLPSEGTLNATAIIERWMASDAPYWKEAAKDLAGKLQKEKP